MADLYMGYQKLKEENKLLKKLISDLTANGFKTIKAYKIYLDGFKKHIVCERCFENGEIDISCNKCGGKGTHYRTLPVWEICKYPIDIVKIDRSPSGREIRFWTSQSEFFESVNYCNSAYPDGIAYIHFSIDDAQRECDKLNKIIKQQYIS